MKEPKKNSAKIENSVAKKNRFVIYCVARTGSYHLASLLDSAGDIVCHGEIFRLNRIELRDAHKKLISPITATRRDAHPWAFISSIRELDSELHFGFKLFRDHARRVYRLRSILRSRRWRKIALLRDPIEVYASLLRAQKTQQWTKRKDLNQVLIDENVAVHFNQQSFSRFAQHYGTYIRDVLSFSRRPDWLLIPYEQLNDTAMQQTILEFLGSRATADELSSNFQKQRERPISEAFDNWDELVKFMGLNDPFRELKWGKRAGGRSLRLLNEP